MGLQPADPTLPGDPESTVAAADRPASASAPSMDDTIPGPGEEIGAFVDQRVLGAGAMGVVLLAEDAELHRKVAIKLLLPTGRTDERARQRMLREAQSVAALAHPNVVGLHQVGMHAGRVYIVMEYVDGGTLRQWVAAQQRSCDEIVDKYRQAAAGLAAAHAAGFVHRDFKPDNVLIGRDGRVRVSDFGLVGASGDSSSAGGDGELVAPDAPVADVRLTQTGALLGTPAYMAPEQFMGASVQAAADQFALCVSLYEALHGRRPFPGNTAGALLMSVQSGQVLPPLRKDVPPHVSKALARGLSADPLQRHPSVAALANALEPPRSRRGTMAGVALGTVGVLALGAATALYVLDADAPAAASAAAAAEEPPCPEPTAHVPPAWTDELREGLPQRLARAGVDDVDAAVARLIDVVGTTGAGIGQARTALCEAAREGVDAEELAATTRCLDELSARFDTMIEVVGSADAPGLARDLAVHMEQLMPPARCRSAARPVVSAVEPVAAATVRTALMRAHLYRLSGEPADAESFAREAVTAAEAAGADGARFEALVLVAHAQMSRADRTEAEESMRQAQSLARRLDDPGREWRATLQLAALVAADAERAKEGVAMIAAADTAAARAGEQGSGKHEALVADVYLAAGEHALALSHASGAVDRLGADENASAIELTFAHYAVAQAHIGMGAVERAQTAYADAERVARERLGKAHPVRAAMLRGEGLALIHQGKADAAAPKLDEAQRILELDPKVNRRQLAQTLLMRADMEYQRMRPDEAKRAAVRAIELFGDAPGDQEHVANALIITGIVEFVQGDYDSAAARFEAAWKIAREHPEPSAISINHLLSVWGGVELARGDIHAALRHHRDALAWLEQRHGPAHAAVAESSANVGDMWMLLQDCEQARKAYAKALGIRSDLALEPDAGLTRILAGSARCSAAAGDIERAEETASRVESLLADGHGAVEVQGRVEMMRAEIAWQRGRHGTARDHAESAKRIWARGGTAFKIQIQDADRWLAAHSSP